MWSPRASTLWAWCRDYISVQELTTFLQANCRRPEEISDISLKMLISLQVGKEMHESGNVSFAKSFPFYDDMGTESYKFIRSRDIVYRSWEHNGFPEVKREDC
jgi:hypothetical protein